MAHHDESDWGPHDELGLMIEKKPYVEPDPGLSQRIMSNLRPKRPGWLKSVYLRLTTPFTLSMSPLTASVAAAFMIISGGFFFKAMTPDDSVSLTSRQMSSHVPVVFRFQAPQASSVSVIGTFNHWNPKGYEMSRDPETGNWSIGIDLSPGKHDYVFLVNGKEIAPDPQADVSKADDYGHRNSTVFVKGHNGQEI